MLIPPFPLTRLQMLLLNLFSLIRKEDQCNVEKGSFKDPRTPSLSLFLVYRHFVRILADVGFVIFLDLIALTPGNAQNEIVE